MLHYFAEGLNFNVTVDHYHLFCSHLSLQHLIPAELYIYRGKLCICNVGCQGEKWVKGLQMNTIAVK